MNPYIPPSPDKIRAMVRLYRTLQQEAPAFRPSKGRASSGENQPTYSAHLNALDLIHSISKTCGVYCDFVALPEITWAEKQAGISSVWVAGLASSVQLDRFHDPVGLLRVAGYWGGVRRLTPGHVLEMVQSDPVHISDVTYGQLCHLTGRTHRPTNQVSRADAFKTFTSNPVFAFLRYVMDCVEENIFSQYEQCSTEHYPALLEQAIASMNQSNTGGDFRMEAEQLLESTSDALTYEQALRLKDGYLPSSVLVEKAKKEVGRQFLCEYWRRARPRYGTVPSGFHQTYNIAPFRASVEVSQ